MADGSSQVSLKLLDAEVSTAAQGLAA